MDFLGEVVRFQCRTLISIYKLVFQDRDTEEEKKKREHHFNRLRNGFKYCNTVILNKEIQVSFIAPNTVGISRTPLF